MDSIRSAYKTEMRFFTDDPRTTTVQWYFVSDQTPMFPYPTPFRSRNWDSSNEGWEDDLGEVWGAAREWVNGSKVGTAKPTRFCGTRDQWRNGQALPPDPPVDVDGNGTPLCCERTAPPPSNVCPILPAGQTPAQVLVDLTAVGDGTCDCGPFRQILPLDRDTSGQQPCTWSGAFAFPCGLVTQALVEFEVQGPVDLLMQIGLAGADGTVFRTVSYVSSGFAWPGNVPVTLTYPVDQPQVQQCTWPATVLITPHFA